MKNKKTRQSTVRRNQQGAKRGRSGQEVLMEKWSLSRDLPGEGGRAGEARSVGKVLQAEATARVRAPGRSPKEPYLPARGEASCRGETGFFSLLLSRTPVRSVSVTTDFSSAPTAISPIIVSCACSLINSLPAPLPTYFTLSSVLTAVPR